MDVLRFPCYSCGMRIVHFSDWHGQTLELPAADLYVCTGDMLPNFLIHTIRRPDGTMVAWETNLHLLGGATSEKPSGDTLHRAPDHVREARLQTAYLAAHPNGNLRRCFGTPDAPVICCRGNHDFVDIAPMFAGGPVFEISEDATRTFVHPTPSGPVTVGGFRGMLLYRGEWSDEMPDARFAERCSRVPADVDLLVTHQPPYRIRDLTWRGHLAGSPAMETHLRERADAGRPYKAHLFGHIHEVPGVETKFGTVFSNAATTFNVIEL
jgi:DNA repair exonuclease SbcCD nuclease subunit